MSAIRAIHAGCRQLGIEDEDKRDFYAQVTGKRSLREMSQTEQKSIVSALRERGFRPQAGKSKRLMQGRYAKKLQALWIAAWNLGLVENRRDEALAAFIKRQTGLDHSRFLRHAADANKAIEALKGWMAREAEVDWTQDGTLAEWTQTNGARIAWAQWQKAGSDAMPGMQRWQFGCFAAGLAGKRVEHMTHEGDWIPVMNLLGNAIRNNSRVEMIGGKVVSHG